MSILSVIGTLFLAFYLGVGIGTVLKFSESMSVNSAVKIILLQPVQVIIVSIMIFLGVLSLRFKAIRLEFEGGVVKRFLRHIYVAWVCLMVCIECMPMFAGKLAYLTLKSRPVKHVMKKTKNDFMNSVGDQVLCY